MWLSPLLSLKILQILPHPLSRPASFSGWWQYMDLSNLTLSNGIGTPVELLGSAPAILWTQIRVAQETMLEQGTGVGIQLALFWMIPTLFGLISTLQLPSSAPKCYLPTSVPPYHPLSHLLCRSVRLAQIYLLWEERQPCPSSSWAVV